VLCEGWLAARQNGEEREDAALQSASWLFLEGD
jgi:hypothetical protein